MKKFLCFDKMITPAIINIAYWVGIIAITVGALTYMFSSGFGTFLEGLILLIAGLIALRIAAELIMVIFKANAALQKIAGNEDDTLDDEIGDAIDGFFDKMKHKADEAKERVSEAKEKIKAKTDKAEDAIEEAADKVEDTVEDVVEDIKDAVKKD